MEKNAEQMVMVPVLMPMSEYLKYQAGMSSISFNRDEVTAGKGEEGDEDDTFVTISDIARLRGVSPSSVSQQPWLLPNFGRGFKEGERRKWTMLEYLSWDRVSRKVHKDEYLKMLKEEAGK